MPELWVRVAEPPVQYTQISEVGADDQFHCIRPRKVPLLFVVIPPATRKRCVASTVQVAPSAMLIAFFPDAAIIVTVPSETRATVPLLMVRASFWLVPVRAVPSAKVRTALLVAVTVRSAVPVPLMRPLKGVLLSFFQPSVSE